jgi:hypothetical protein
MVLIRLVLSVVFLWAIGKTVSVLFFFDSMDLLLLRDKDEEWLFWLIVPVAGLLTIGALIYPWAPSAALYHVAQAAVALGLLETLLVGLLAADDPTGAKEAFVAARHSRGLPVREEVLELMDNPNVHYWPIMLAAVMAALWLYLLFVLERSRRRDEKERSETTATGVFTNWH